MTQGDWNLIVFGAIFGAMAGFILGLTVMSRIAAENADLWREDLRQCEGKR